MCNCSLHMSEVYSFLHPPHFILSTTCILSNLLLQIIQSMKPKDISAHFYQQNVILCKSCCQQEGMPKEKWKNPNSFCPQKNKLQFAFILQTKWKQQNFPIWGQNWDWSLNLGDQMAIDRKIPTLWRTAEMLSQKNFSSTGHLSLFLLHQWNATWDI